nr:MAG TPA: shock protein B [Caudoviricetes sp.]
METINIILNFILASGMVGTVLFFKSKKRKEAAEADSAELKNTEQIVSIQSEQISRLDGRVNKLEHEVGKLEIIIEHKDSEIDKGRNIIRQAYKCKIPPEECPVLCKKAELEEQEKADKEKQEEQTAEEVADGK